MKELKFKYNIESESSVIINYYNFLTMNFECIIFLLMLGGSLGSIINACSNICKFCKWIYVKFFDQKRLRNSN